MVGVIEETMHKMFSFSVQSDAIYNLNRRNILNIIITSKEPLTITKIHKKMKGISYKNIHKHIQILKEAGFITLKKDTKASGQAVFVRYNPSKRVKEFIEITATFKKYKTISPF